MSRSGGTISCRARIRRRDCAASRQNGPCQRTARRFRTRLPAGPIRDNPRTWELLEAAAKETDAVARARGVELPDNAVEDIVQMIRRLPNGMKASMLVDLERGNRLELEWLSGAVCRLGREAGIDTPVHDVVLAALAPFVAGTPAS